MLDIFCYVLFMKKVVKKILKKRGLSVNALAAMLNVPQPSASRDMALARIEPNASADRLLEALQCHAEVVIVDDVTGERYELD